jgi:hypothetical protein
MKEKPGLPTRSIFKYRTMLEYIVWKALVKNALVKNALKENMYNWYKQN